MPWPNKPPSPKQIKKRARLLRQRWRKHKPTDKRTAQAGDYMPGPKARCGRCRCMVYLPVINGEVSQLCWACVLKVRRQRARDVARLNTDD